MACEGCHEEIKRKNAKSDGIRKIAQDKANETNEWVGICFGGQIYIGKETVGKAIKEYFTPKLQDTSV